MGSLRYAIRHLKKNPLFAFVAIASLALGLGANTAIFGILDQVLLRPLPVKNPHELVLISDPGPNHGMFNGDDSDLYREHINASLTNIPTGSNYDLYLYKLAGHDCAVGTHAAIAQGNQPGDTNESLTWEEPLGTDDTGEYMICVTRVSGFSCDTQYELTVDGLTYWL